ncbi:MAG: PQQ-binding-like beta-propeller repeat protein, partial [Methanosarcinales archaeon]|nr:PQQ-binding-like beta-propeller repeat protein [Methanosarcinales archaeon]
MRNPLAGVICFLMMAIVAVLAVSLVAGGQADNDSAVPPEVAAYSSDWPLANRDYANTRATEDSAINSDNVLDLGLAWSFPIPGIGAYGGGASNPLIQGERVFFQDLQANVFCLDLASGRVLWEKIYNSTSVVGPNGPAAGWGKVFLARDLYNLTALDLENGEELWSARLSPVSSTGIDIQPAIYDGMVYASTVPGTGDVFYAPGGIGVIYALDQETGVERWNFSTVDSPDLWGHPEVNSGGGCWFTPAVDLATGIMFWAIANPAPFPGTGEWPSGSSRPGPNLYTNTMMALNHESGEMAWYRQVLPHDLLDHDLQIAPILATLDPGQGGQRQDLVYGAGKMGRVYAFNRSTGELLWVTSVGLHTQESQLDRLPEGTTRIYPGVLGGVETPMAYSNGTLFVPVVDLHTDWTPTELDASTLDFSQGRGELVALDAATGKILWIRYFDSMALGGATVVNDLVFTATYDGSIYAFEARSGERVFKYQAPAGINGWPAVAGDTIVWPAGVGAAPSLIALRLGAEDASPQARILELAEGQVVQAGNLTVSVQVENFNLTDELGAENVAGEGHIHYYMDVQGPRAPGEKAVSGPGTYVASSE